MRFLRRSSAEQTASTDAEDGVEQTAEERAQHHTPKKGKPTPKRREAEGRRRGPVPPPPMTQREAVKRARGNKEERRKATQERRERMMQGDDRYLMPRDKGPVRAHVRDLVDTRRHLMGLFMPLVLIVFATTLAQNLLIQQYATLFCLALLIMMVVEGTLLGRYVNKRVRAKFPDHQDRPFSLGWYAFTRAMQIRKLRVPRPRYTPKDIAKIG
ncbi:DUF3043 domain-containing protein [Saccharopolyspora rhizosphaerae]|uniref:DUF3043 domain-containing protein n=1 Tax=Saccharopolyspora rhizosphaerae TaxID=2492662 RepID=A0A426JNX3_9PSEU|nr:DUF3043 domain-containing protein [Saccharopolyspora rhizosphaerae]RRO14918.1 DUF3043 domain-containing protein [Saccharopolyspora rhizosphaerae]